MLRFTNHEDHQSLRQDSETKTKYSEKKGSSGSFLELSLSQDYFRSNKEMNLMKSSSSSSPESDDQQEEVNTMLSLSLFPS